MPGSGRSDAGARSIASEVATVLSNRCSGFLRERASDIHATIAVAGGEAA
jgi:hypothetical protein